MDRKLEPTGQYDEAAEVQIYADVSRRGVVAWIERRFVKFLLKKWLFRNFSG